MAEITWTAEAQRWLEDIFEYVAADNPDAAGRTVQGIYDRAQDLVSFPEIGYRYLATSRHVRILLYGATLPRNVHFTQGLEALVCMSLSDHGLLRWYTSCCSTPIGNTPRDFKTSYVGLIHSCLATRTPSLQDSFGPVRMVLQTNSAKGKVASTPMSNFVTMLKIMKSVIAARMSGSYKSNPFFVQDSGTPIKQPRVLTKAERTRVTNAV